MKRYLIFTLLLLTACVPTTSAPGVDPAFELERAKVQAEYYASQLTATAVAPILEVTRAAAALEMTVQVQNLQGTQTAIPLTSTAQSWTPTVTATPTVNVTGTIAVEQMNAEIEKMRLETERSQNTNSALAVAPYFVGFFLLALVLLLGFVGAKRLSMMPTPIHERTGKPIPMINVYDGVVIDTDRMPNGMAVMNRKYVASLPVLTAEVQGAVTARAQTVDLQTRIARLPKALVESQGRPMLEAPAQLGAGNDAAGFLFPLPAWDLVNGWQGEKNILPYGLTANGLGLVDVDQFPHMATIGKTGEGKSRRFFRPLIACALAAGHRVVVVGKTTDFVVFADHPNMTIVKVAQITKPEHAARYVAILQALVEEMNRRDEYLTAAHKSTWAHAGRERTFLVLDELQNAMRLMPTQMEEQVRLWVAGLVSEGRKVGFNVSVAGQRATGMAEILSQTGKAIFRVARDEEKAHRSLQGASGLRSGYFYAHFDDVRLTGAFEPSDAELATFLASRPAQPLERDWVDGRVVETFQNSLPAEPTPSNLPEPKTDLEKLAESIRPDWKPDMSKRKVAQLIGKEYAGGAVKIVDALISLLNSNLSTEGVMQ